MLLLIRIHYEFAIVTMREGPPSPMLPGPFLYTASEIYMFTQDSRVRIMNGPTFLSILLCMSGSLLPGAFGQGSGESLLLFWYPLLCVSYKYVPLFMF
jgi:hypothetical protein